MRGVDSTVCGCGSIETFFTSIESAPVCESCGVSSPEDTPSACYACGSSDRIAARSFQGRNVCSKGYGMLKKGAKVGVCFMTAALFAGPCFSAASGVGNLLIDDPEVIGCLGNVGKLNHWWDAKGGLAGWIPGSSTCGHLQAHGELSSCMDTRVTPCYHIVESWGIEKMMQEPPTMICYARIWVTGILRRALTC